MPFVGFDEQTLLRVLSVAVEQNFSPIYVTDVTGAILYVNMAFCRMTGYGHEELLGSNARKMKSGLLSKEYYQEMWSKLLVGESWKGEFPNLKKNGELYWESSMISPIKNDANEITYFVAVMEDITQMKRDQETLKTQASTDSLTAVLNRRMGVQVLEKQMASAAILKTPLSLAYVDLNGLKAVNDHLGHKKGDELILYFCRFIQERIQANDTLCRMGGDEFMIILPGSELSRAQGIVTDIHDEFVHTTKSDLTNEGFSFGVAEFDPEHRLSVDRFISFTDKKMYLNKQRYYRAKAREAQVH